MGIKSVAPFFETWAKKFCYLKILSAELRINLESLSLCPTLKPQGFKKVKNWSSKLSAKQRPFSKEFICGA